MLAAFFGFGSAKLRGKYNTARQWFTAGVAADNGYNLSEELTTRELSLSLIHISPRGALWQRLWLCMGQY